MRRLVLALVITLIALFAVSVGFAQQSVFVAAPVIHDPDAGIYTAFCVANQTLVPDGNTIYFKPIDDLGLFWITDEGDFERVQMKSLSAAATLYFHTGDIFGDTRFRGMVVFTTFGSISGSVHVLGAHEPVTGRIEKVEAVIREELK